MVEHGKMEVFLVAHSLVGHFEDGWFHRGTFAGGTWKGGAWGGGTWIKGKIWDKELDKYVESDVNPNEYFKNKK
jgi:hypothetical protein